MSYLGINPINVEGSNFNDCGYGYSKFIRIKKDNKLFNPLIAARINPFGMKNYQDKIKKNVYGKIIEQKKNLTFYSKTSNPKINGFLNGISTIIVGEDIWGPQSGFKLGRVKDYKKLKINTKWNFKVKKGFADFVYDLWLTKKDSGMIKSNDVEIMVWLDSNFDIPWKEVGKYEEFIVKYKRKTKKEHPHDPGHTFAFIPNKKANKLMFDYKKLLSYCSKYLTKNLDNYWIRSIYLGTEFANNTEVEVKLYRSEIKI